MGRVGVIGLGGMGASLVDALLAADHEVICFDLRPEAVESARRHGARGAASSRAVAAEADVVMTFLPGPRQVLEVALDPSDGIVAALRPGVALLDLSTCGPDVAERLGAAFDEKGRRFYDCPVSRKAPNMTVLVGGAVGCLGADEAVLADVSRTLVYCGRRGAGYVTKLLNQQVKYSWYLASAEALLVAEAWGLDAPATAEAISQCSGGDSGLAAAAEYFREDLALVRAHAPASTIQKDAALAEVMAACAGVRARSLGVVTDFFETVGSTGFRERPYPESIELLRALRSMPRQNGAAT